MQAKQMLATPDYSHLTATSGVGGGNVSEGDHDSDNVYEPSEDTFLLLDALEQDMAYLNARKPCTVVEIGCGSGVVVNFLAMHMADRQRIAYHATDINLSACVATRATALRNQNESRVHVVNCDLLAPLEHRLAGQIDVLLFNPPYVVTEAHELGSRSLPAAWAGGKDGREVMDRLFPRLDRLLSASGVFYLVCIKPNRIEQIETLLGQLGFEMQTIMNRKAGIENLFVLRFTRMHVAK